MKTEFILVLAILVLAAPVDAKPEKITIRPCNVSFDMGKVGDIPSLVSNLRIRTLQVSIYKVQSNDQRKESIESRLDLWDYHGLPMAEIEKGLEDAMKAYGCGEPKSKPDQ